MKTKEEIDYSKIEYTREWFDENQAHTILDIADFKRSSCDNIIHIGEHFLLDLYSVNNDVEIWEVELTSQTYYDKKRKQWFCFKPIRNITTGKQFGYPNGYWKVKQLKSSIIGSEELPEEIVKIIDPDNTFLNECENIVKKRFGSEEGKC